MSEEVQQAKFEGWAIVEMMGHRVEIGFVTTQAFGPAVLFRVDTPGLLEREYTLTQPGYAEVDGGRQWCPEGTKVKRQGTPARSCLVAPSSLYAINPCSEEAARTRMERSIERPLIALEIPKRAEIAASLDLPENDDEEVSDDDEEVFDMALQEEALEKE